MKINPLKYYISILLFACGALALHADSEKQPEQTRENYTLKFNGNYQDAEPLNLVLVGTGSEFSVHLVDPIRSIQASLVALPNGKFAIKYLIGASLPVKVENNVSYRDTRISGEVVVTLGKPVPIIKLSERALTLTLEKYSDK